MNLGNLRASLRSRIGNPSTADVPDTPNLDGHINNAYQEILDKYKFKRRRGRKKFTTITGTDKYYFAGVTDVVYKVWDRTNGRSLEKIGKTRLAQEDFDATPNALVQNGKPLKWIFTETYLQILPPPDGAYKIEFIYKVLITPLAQAADLPIIPVTWHRGIYILAAAIYYEDEGGDPVKSLFHRNSFKDWVSDKPVEEHEETEAIDSGVEVPTLQGQSTRTRRPDGVWWDSLP